MSHCDHTAHHDHHAHMAADFKWRFWISLALSIPVLMLSPTLASLVGLESLSFVGSQYVALGFAAIVFFYGGWPFLTGLYEEVSGGRPGMMTLVAVAITVAFVYSAAVVFGLQGEQLLWELVTLVDVMLLGHWIEMRSVMGASRALEELARLLPDTAHRLTNSGEIEEVSVKDLAVGDRVRIRPGEHVPADGRVVGGGGSVDEHLVTGESKPVAKEEGDEVIGGTVNGEGSLTVEVTKTGADTYLSQITTLVREAQASETRTQNLANRAAMWLTFVALGAGAVTLAAWSALGADNGYALQRTIAVVVIACPHALGLAIPLVVAVSTTRSAAHGLLIRDRTAFEAARNIDTVVFDKTGTLTTGDFRVTDVVVLNDTYSRDEILQYAASLEAHSEHPIARAITEEADGSLEVKRFEALRGEGVSGTLANGTLVKVVSAGYLSDQNTVIDSGDVAGLSDEGKTLAYVMTGENNVVGVIALDDTIRDEARGAVRILHETGVEVVMLTGDNQAVAQRVARELSIDDFVADVKPDEKSQQIRRLQEAGKRVAMVGDGVNDAPALATADVGVAIGAGTDVAVETADIVLVKNNPEDVARLISFSRATYAKMVQNLWWAAGYNIVALPLAAGVLAGVGIVLSPAVGAILMSVSTVVVAVNATLLHFKQ